MEAPARGQQAVMQQPSPALSANPPVPRAHGSEAYRSSRALHLAFDLWSSHRASLAVGSQRYAGALVGQFPLETTANFVHTHWSARLPCEKHGRKHRVLDLSAGCVDLVAESLE